MVRAVTALRPRDYHMWLIILQSQMHSREASYSVTISEWFMDVVAKVCFDIVHDMAVPFCKNMKPIYDMPLWGSDWYPALVYHIILEHVPLWKNTPRSLMPLTYLRICFTPVQYLLVGAARLASKFTTKAMSGLVLLARYINAPMALRYGTYGPRISSPSSRGLNGLVFSPKDQITIGVL